MKPTLMVTTIVTLIHFVGLIRLRNIVTVKVLERICLLSEL